MYKQRFYSIISIFLCISILFSLMPLHVFAEEHIATDSNATATYVFDESGNEVCSECGKPGSHSEDCSLHKEIGCACESEIHSEDCPFYEEQSDPIYSVEDDAEIICLCLDGVHSEECYLYEEPVMDECVFESEIHDINCSLYKEIIIDKDTCSCGSDSDVHTMDCVLYEEITNTDTVCSCNTSTDIHKESCELYETPEITFGYLMSINSLEELYKILYNQYEMIADFENLEKELLLTRVAELYDSIEEPTEDDTEKYNYLRNIINSYIIVICEKCGQENGIHLDDCEFWVCDECGQNEHDSTCSKYFVIDVVCSECNEKNGIHLDTCSLFVNNDEICEECQSLEHIETCSKYVVSDVLCSECGEKDGIHLETCSEFEVICTECEGKDNVHNEDCSLYVCEECEGTEGYHLESCSKYVKVCEECNQKGDVHLETCSLYICNECNHNKHIRGCSLYVLTIFDILNESNSLDEFYENLLNEAYFENVLELTSEEIESLADVVIELYNNIESPLEEDSLLRDEIIETLSVLPNGSVDLGLKILNYLEWSGNVNGLTLTQDVILVGDTYMSSTITVPSGAVVTIDLNGYMLHGSGNGTIINNSGKLTIKDSRPNHGVHKFRKVSDGPWVLDESGEYTVIGGLVTGGRDLTSISAGASGGGAVKQGTNKLSQILNIEGGTFIGNSSTRAGGAFYGGAVTMSGGLIIGNFADGFGGGISLSGSFTMTGGEIRENETAADSKYNTASPFYENASVIIGQQSSFNMTGGKLVGNMSTVNNKTGATTFNMSGGEVVGKFKIINGLNANLSGGTLNGSVYLQKGSCIVSDDMLIYGGTQELGGAIQVQGGNFEMNGGIIRNSSAIQGGAIYVTGGNVEINDGVISHSSADRGGAIYVDGGIFTMNGGEVHNNTADYGGAIYVSGGQFRVYDGHIYSNIAIDGGAAFIDGGSVIDIYNGTFENNEAYNNGGAIYAASDTTDITVNVFDGEIINNSAGNHAGAIGVNVSGNYAATLNIGDEDCLGVNTHIHDDDDCPVIDSNTAARLGGAFCIHGNAEKLAVNIYCGDVVGNIAIRNPGSNSINQAGGALTVWGGQIDPGIMVGGGIYTDNRLNSGQMILRFWSNYDGGATEPNLVEVTSGVNVTFPLDTYIWSGHELSGWATKADATGLYIPAQGEHAISYDPSGYLDFYAVWDADTSYIVYIPESLDIDSDWQGEMIVSADVNYFRKNSNLNIFVNSDFELTGASIYDSINYMLTSSEFGGNNIISNNGIAATFQYNNVIDKIITASLILSDLDKLYSGYYSDLITFTVEYSEVIED